MHLNHATKVCAGEFGPSHVRIANCHDGGALGLFPDETAAAANAARIVACVNACEKFADPAFQIGALESALNLAVRERDEARSSNEALARALREARGWVLRLLDLRKDRGAQRFLAKLDAALAQHKETPA